MSFSFTIFGALYYLLEINQCTLSVHYLFYLFTDFNNIRTLEPSQSPTSSTDALRLMTIAKSGLNEWKNCGTMEKPKGLLQNVLSIDKL